MFLFNPRITSKNVAGIIPNILPILQVIISDNKKPLINYILLPLYTQFKSFPQDIKAAQSSTDPSEFHMMIKVSPDFHQEVSIDDLKTHLNHPLDSGAFIWIVKILYKNTKYRAFSHKCYILGKKWI